MRQVIASLLLVCSLGPGPAAFQTATAGKPVVRACSLLTKQLMTEFTPYEKPVLDIVLRIPPTEDALGSSGSACSFGGVTLQVDPFTPQALERVRKPDWVPVTGVGDASYFHDNRGEYAELYARAGARVLTIQMDVPTGRTAASIKPNVIALAKAILPRLK
jgi:hypothetical protein